MRERRVLRRVHKEVSAIGIAPSPLRKIEQPGVGADPDPPHPVPDQGVDLSGLISKLSPIPSGASDLNTAVSKTMHGACGSDPHITSDRLNRAHIIVEEPGWSDTKMNPVGSVLSRIEGSAVGPVIEPL